MAGRTDRTDRAMPLAALLVLFCLLLGVSPQLGGTVRDTSARLGAVRPGASPSLLRTAERATLSDQAAPDQAKAFLPPSPPQIATRTVAYPTSACIVSAASPPATPAPAAYRARAPPAA
ncbi:hypothetical protein E2493_09200 [Sphingomonas parva]|uniref:Uncharacterized protein n=1 Tax=Sphingomonas parva TaxID=2555898 RepID=A0A4Y8ZRE8_9SPHN|nr:hypothetical protein [Sphingomonas parva]TFI58591.1 hypothetical protein E2493_09200 [Sphingomonas parva]